MRVLFIPYPEGVLSHGIPLVALRRMLAGHAECSFLVPRARAPILHALGAEALDIDHRDFRTEMVAYGKFRPDVVIDDCSLTTAHAAKLAGIPRVSIVRTGSFRHQQIRSEAREHSMRIDFTKMPDVSFLGLRQPENLADLCEGDIHIIPGIPSIEPLPQALAGDPRYVYAGPLLVEDHLVANEASFAGQPDMTVNFGALEEFLEAAQDRKLVYVTLGSVAVDDAGEEIRDLIRKLCRRGVAVVGNVTLDSSSASESYFYSRYLPMHRICRRASVVVHHCGSGTYHYPLLHHKPSVIVDTGCYDRVDVARRLNELGLAKYLPADGGQSLFEAVEQAMNDPAHLRQARFEAATRAIEQTAAEFDLPEILSRLNGKPGRRPTPTHRTGVTHAC